MTDALSENDTPTLPESELVAAYFDRIDLCAQYEPTIELLGKITWHHQLAIPFENLDIALFQQPIRLDPASLFDKLVRRRRGGYCYEQNGVLALMLTQLGYDATLGYASWITRNDDRIVPFDHLVLQVAVPDTGNIYLADVGFGRDAPARPILLQAGHTEYQPETARAYRVSQSKLGGYQWQIQKQEADDAWSLLYDVDLTPRTIAEYDHRNLFNQTSPESHFTHGPICSKPTLDGRITLSPQTFVRTRGQDRIETSIETNADLVRLLRDWFQIDIDVKEIVP